MAKNVRDEPAIPSSDPHLTIGVGASAGGLEAFQDLLSHVDAESGLSFVLVQHLPPLGERLLAEVLVNLTQLSVVELSGRTKPAPNTVYIAPANGLLKVEDGYLVVTSQVVTSEVVTSQVVANQASASSDETVSSGSPREGSGSSTVAKSSTTTAAIDHFLQSLADDQRDRSVGVILSGAGSDGTLGLKAISDAGGLTFAQDPDSAKYDSMPRNAAAMGVADHVLPPAEIASELISYARHLASLSEPRCKQEVSRQLQEAIPQVTDLLLKNTGHNFQHYKTNTLSRRIQRRMQVNKLSDVEKYIEILSGNPDEAHTLFRELLIGVTSFFRDPDAFAALSESVLPKLFEDKSPDDHVRIWVAGCATGEEAYTLAILCREYMDSIAEANSNAASDSDGPESTSGDLTGVTLPTVQIFATDLDDRALQVARDGAYPVGIADVVSPERLKRFFVKRGKKYQVAKEIRELVLFSPHNLISDPPFSRLDLVSCRNLLIYLGPHLQKKLIPLFHYSLRPSGYLFLGPSENISAHRELFRVVDPKAKISQRKNTGVDGTAVMPVADGSGKHENGKRAFPAPASTEGDLLEVMQRIVLDEFAPKCAIVDEDGHVLCTSGDMQKYLTVSGGKFQNNIIQMARSGLRLGLRAAFQEAVDTRRQVTHDNQSLRLDDRIQRVMLTVQPMPEVGEDSGLFMVVFHDVGLPLQRGEAEDLEDDSPDRTPEHRNADAVIKQLEKELATTRADLERALRDMECSNEDLKSSNEELVSMNEELQSANEELETSKEEVQAALTRVAQSASDRRNLLHSTSVATLFVDDDMTIRSFTPDVAKIYNLLPNDVGRPLSHITHTAVEMPDFPADASAVSEWPIEDEVEIQTGNWYLRRIQPYLTDDDQQNGLVVTFYDITDRKRTFMRLAASHAVRSLLVNAESFATVIPEVLHALLDALEAEVCLLWRPDESGKLLTCVEASTGDHARQSFVDFSRQLTFSKGEGLPGIAWKQRKPIWFEDLQNADDFARSKVAHENNLVSGIATPIVVGKKFKGVIEIFTTRLLAHDPELKYVLESVGTDIGQFIRRRRLDSRFRDEEARKTAILKSAMDCIVTMDVEGRIVDFNPAAERTFGHVAADVIGKPMCEVIMPDEFRPGFHQSLKRYLEVGESSIIGKRIELTSLRADGSTFPMELGVSVSHTLNGSPFFTGYLRDITDRRRSEDLLRDRESHLRRVIDNTLFLVGVLDVDGTLLEANAAAVTLGGIEREEVIGKKFWDCIWWNHSEDTISQLQDDIRRGANGEIVRHDAIVRIAGDTRITIDFMLSPVRDESGRVTHLIPSGVDISDRKAAERQALQRERHLNFAMVAGRMGSWEWDIVNDHITWSDHLYELYGYEKDEFVGTAQGFLDIVIPDDRPIVEAVIESIMLTTSEREEFECRIFRKRDGHIILGQIQGIVDRDAVGRPLRIAGFATDITDRNRRERHVAFLAELQSFLAPLETADEIARVATERIAQYLNLSRCALVDLDEDAALANVYFDYHIDEVSSVVGLYTMSDYLNADERQRLAVGGSLVFNDVTQECSTPDSAARFAALQIQAIVNSAYVTDGRLEFMLTATKHYPYQWRSDELQLLNELSANVYLRVQRARVQSALQQTDERLSTALQVAGMAAWEWSPQESIWTAELYDLLGISPDQPASPELFFSLTHPDDRDELQAEWQRSVDGDTNYSHEFRIIRPDGETRWLNGVGKVVRNEAGEVVRMYGLNRDTTAEHVAASRLEEARRQAEQANSSKSEFLANMSHEIRTPMTAVLGYADLLLDAETDPQKLQHLETIKRNGNFLLEIINDILDLSKIEAGRMEIDRQQFSPQALVGDVRSLMDVRAKEKDLQFEVQYDGSVPEFIESDPKRLKQILVNLLGNALKFTDAGSVILRISHRPAATKNSSTSASKRRSVMQFDVIDTGIGMTVQQQKRLFKPFSQGDASVTREFGGTGLGLAISKRLAHMLGGSVAVDSTPGEGSTFSLTIAAGDVSNVAFVDPNLPSESQAEAPAELAAVSDFRLACRILLVDDRRDVRFLGKHILQTAGATVEEAENGQQAIDQVSAMDGEEPFDLILLDMQMPGVDGYTAAARLRGMGFENPIIALTADAMHGDMDRCLQSGCNAYLSKPIDKEKLLATVHTFLQQNGDN
ncbi:PAS domain S-box protein [Fuerstiella marisgermanici]|uniref:Sensory/regulatory protein RpfC n=1 Tax=Fuerstiella marisgermanici TaxID=1891926 RepID=A0A1P8WF60_9PLAN|nr:PAS domain S-box protein [Fuerstiella marisgermanici]APZ92718.1 Sensory/regulatory protein RpfC [Fuerstiella marisgermanici]